MSTLEEFHQLHQEVYFGQEWYILTDFDDYEGTWDFEKEEPGAKDARMQRCLKEGVEEFVRFLESQGMYTLTLTLVNGEFVFEETVESLNLTDDQSGILEAVRREMLSNVTPEDYEQMEKGDKFQINPREYFKSHMK